MGMCCWADYPETNLEARLSRMWELEGNVLPLCEMWILGLGAPPGSSGVSGGEDVIILNWIKTSILRGS